MSNITLGPLVHTMIHVLSWRSKLSIIITSEVSRMEVFHFFFTILIWLRYDLLLWLVSDGFWPGFAVMILIRFGLWFWYDFSHDSWCGSKLWFWWDFGCYVHASEDIFHLRMWSPLHPISLQLRKCEFLNCLGSTWESNGKHKLTFTIVSKPYKNNSKLISKPEKPSRNQPKACPRAVSVSFLETNRLGTLKRHSVPKPYQKHIQSISQTMSKI